MPGEEFQVETGAGRFELETTYHLIVPRGARPAAGWPLVLCLHGMGMTAAEFQAELDGMIESGVAYLFPEGVYPFEVRSEGSIRIGHAWYLYDGREEPFRTTLARSEAYLLEMIDRLGAQVGVDPARVFLLGFSQGAYLAYFMVVRNPGRFAGLVGIGGRMREEFVDRDLRGPERPPILMVHGENDKAVPLERARGTFEALERHGFPVELATFPVGHKIRPVEVEAVRRWLGKRLVEIA